MSAEIQASAASTGSVITSPSVIAALFVGLLLAAAAIYIMALSRHRKAGTGELELMGALAVVEASLEPEGAVLVRGELWRARARDGMTIERGRSVRVVGARSHLLEVEPLS